MTTPTTRTATQTSGPHSWPVVQTARWEVQVKRGDFWLMSGGCWYDTKDRAEEEAAWLVSTGNAWDGVRVVTGGWVSVRHATADDIAQYGELV